MKFGLVARAYAPFKVFGGFFHGDNRGPTTRPDVTSRVKTWVVFDPMAGKVYDAKALSDRSSWTLGDRTAVGLPGARVDAVSSGKGFMHFHLHAWGANPMTPKGTPNIDMRVIMTVSLSQGHLNVEAVLSGDQFPNVETMLQDESGQRRMIATYETDAGKHTGPFTRLPGTNARTMNAICKSFRVDRRGLFV
jgi:hypothetical protein